MHKSLFMAVVAASFAVQAHAADFNWRKHEGETITFLANNHPWANAVLEMKDDFEKLTGIKLKVDMYQEQQMRQRLVTVMNSGSDEIDVFMTLPSREGSQFAKAGWYSDLGEFVKNPEVVSPDYDFADFNKALLGAATFDGKLTSMPLNVEGPIVYYRMDILSRCGVKFPRNLTDLPEVLAKIKACDPNVSPFVTRGLKPALPYTFAGFIHNMGGTYIRDGKSQMCSAENKAAIQLYAGLLKDYGPPGVVNYSFYQITSLYRAGKAAISFGSSNEFGNVMEGGARLKDTAVTLLPPGPGGSHPTIIGWGVTISNYSAKKEAAWYFLQWSTSPKVQEKLALKGLVPPRNSTASSPDYKKWIDEEPLRRQWINTINEGAEIGTSEIGYPIVANPHSREFIGQAVVDVFLGNKTVDEACAEADRQLDRLIAQEK